MGMSLKMLNYICVYYYVCGCACIDERGQLVGTDSLLPPPEAQGMSSVRQVERDTSIC